MTNSDSKQNNSTESVRSPLNGLLYFLVGGGIGASLALLFAPKSGVELRTDISDLTKKGYEETVDLAHQLKEQSSEVYTSVKEKTGKVYDLAASKWAHVADTASELPAELINGATKLMEDKSSPKKNAGRRSADIL